MSSGANASVTAPPQHWPSDGPSANDCSLRGTTLTSHDDHRLAMAWGIAGLVAAGETRVEGAGAVDVSYPGFWEMLDRVTR